jgi:hypothetical protein
MVDNVLEAPVVTEEQVMENIQSTMLQRAEDYLAENPQDLDMWIKLITAYKRLKQDEKADLTEQKARALLDNDTQALERLNDALKETDL